MDGPPRGQAGHAGAGRSRLPLLLVVAGVLLPLAAWLLLTPDFLARHLSPDGSLSALTRARVQTLRAALAGSGGLLLLAGLTTRWWHAPLADWRRRHATGLRRAALAAGAAALALLVAEAACRIDERVRPRPGAGFDFARYASACIDDLRARGQLDRHGFRELRLGAPRRAGVPRVLFLGDSFVYGLGIREAADTLPAALERALLAGGLRAEVLNAGICGADTTREAEVLAELLPRARPDVVLLGYYPNDAETEALKQGFQAGARVLPILSDYLLAGSALWRRVEPRLMQALRDAGLRPTYVQHLSALHAPGSPLLAAQLRRLDALQDAVAAAGGACAIVLIPLLDELAPYPLEEVHATLRAHCAARGVPCLDLLDTFRGSDARTWQVSAQDHHLNPAGAARAAQVLAPWLIEGPLAPR